MNFLSDFENELRSAGYEPVKSIKETSGSVWPRLKYMGEKKPSGRYKLFISNDIAYGTYGSDKDPNGFKTWRSWDGQKLKPEDAKKNKEWYEQKKKEEERKEFEKHKRIAKYLTKIYKSLPDAPKDHPYLVKKEIEAHPKLKYRVKDRTLVLPILQMDGKVYSLQFITAKGQKFFFTGGKVKGGFVPLNNSGDDWKEFYIAESYSTGMSLRQATKQPVVCAFTASNLTPVSKSFHKKHTDSLITIAADNDQWPSDKWPKNKKWVNTGVEKAIQAAGHVGGIVKYPEFTDDMSELKPTDWNDYACFYGIEKLKSALRTNPTELVPFPEKAGSAVNKPPTHDTVPNSPPNQITPAEKKWIELESEIRWHKGTVGFFDKDYSQHNAILFLSYHPAWEGTFVYDEFAIESRIVKALPWDNKATFSWRNITDTDLTQLRALLWSKHNIKISSKSEMNETIEVVARNKSVHPVREYLDSLVWDAEPRLNTYLIKYCKPLSGHHDYISRVGACFLLAAVKRIYAPATFHKQMLILEGHQDIGKSEFLKTLSTFNGISYFSDQIGFEHIGSPYLASFFSNKIILEFQELTGFNMKDRNKIKAFISQTHDDMQAKYTMRVESYPRQFVLAGTTNDANWMNDPTGGIRFWPIHCGKIDIEGLKQVVEQLWAEAVYRIKQGEPHWITDDDPLYDLMKAEQASRYDGHVWLEPIKEYVRTKDQVHVDEILREALFISIENWNKIKKDQIADCLRELGWTAKSVWCKEEKRTTRKWMKPT